MTITKTEIPRVGLHALLAGILSMVIGAAATFVGGMHLSNLAKGESLGPDERLPLAIILAGALIGIGGATAAIMRYGYVVARAHDARPLWVTSTIGAVWGALAVVIAGLLETLDTHLPKQLDGSFVNNLLAGPIEEGAKLLLPVLLLIFSARMRDPRRGFWMALVAASVFGVLEGVGYISQAIMATIQSGAATGAAEHGALVAIAMLDRGMVELMHPVLTAGAAGIIWFAAHTRTRGTAFLIGLLAYLGAAALHGFNDAVISGLLSPINPWIGALVAYLFIALLFVFWFRPQAARIGSVSVS